MQARRGDAAPPGAFRLGMDGYSLRSLGWDLLKLVDYSIERRMDRVQLSVEGVPLDSPMLSEAKRRSASAGLTLEASTGCICSQANSWRPKEGGPAGVLEAGIRKANAMGAGTLRCFLGNNSDRTGAVPLEAKIDEVVQTLKRVRALAQDMQVKIALENHGDLLASEIKTLIEEAGRDFSGVTFDTGNCMHTMEDPLRVLETLAPFIITTHLRDSVLYEHPRGAAFQWVAMGEGCFRWKEFTVAARRLCPQAPLLLEIITGRPPRVIPFLEQDFWKGYARLSPPDFSHFLKLAKSGLPFEGFMIIADGVRDAPESYRAALRDQQRRDLERSLEYCRRELGWGISQSGG